MSTTDIAKGRVTKRPEYDLPTTKGDCLDIPPILPILYAGKDNDQEPGIVSPVVSGKDLHSDNSLTLNTTIVDLFCGAGGMSLGFEDAGFNVVLGVDFNSWACRTFAANVPAQVVVKNIEQIRDFNVFFTRYGITEVAGIVGGPPCQGFSRVGKGRIRHQNRLNGYTEPREDPRNGLYKQFLAAVEALKPLFFVMENVPDMDSYADDEGLLAERIEAEFRALNYRVSRRVLIAADFGVPQRRSRLFFVGFHERLGRDFVWPDPQLMASEYGIQSLRQAIGDLPEITDGQLARELPYTPHQKHWLSRWYRKGINEAHQNLIFDHITRPHREDDKEYFRMLGEGQRFVDLPEEARRYRSDIFQDKYRKLKWDEPSWTVTAHLRRDSYRYIHPQLEPPRTISVREAARLQSFPDRWRFCGHRSNAFEQVGNAVPPLLARAIAREVFAQITQIPQPLDPLLTGNG